MREDVRNVGGDEPVVGGRVDGARGRDPVDRFEEGGGVRAQDPDPPVGVFLEVVAQPPRAVGGFLVVAPQDGARGGGVVDCLGLCVG